MKYKILWGFLGAEAAVCVLIRILQASFSGLFSSVMAFPFEQLGMGLRTLSLSNRVGNAVAILIYSAISLLPAATIFILWKKRGLHVEDGLLGLLSVVLFAVLYLMINPGIIRMLTGGAVGMPIGKAILGGMVYSVLCGYLVLRVLRLFSLGGTDKLARYMTIMLGLMAALFVYLAFGTCFVTLLDSISALRTGNTGNEHLLCVCYVFLVLQFIVDALPYVLDVFVIFAAIRLLDELRTNRYSAEAVAATERMSRLCVAALVATVLSNIGFNLLQLLFVKSLMVINSSVEIPVLTITFVLAALLLTRFVAENKRLKDDNDMFI